MNPRTMIALCVVAAFGGAIVSGFLLSPPGTATASAPEGPEQTMGPHELPNAEIACIVYISHASVQGSNICTKDSSAKWIHTETHGADGGSEGSDSSHGSHSSHSSNSTHSSHNSTTQSEEKCRSSSMVAVQACDMMQDWMNDGEMMNGNAMNMLNQGVASVEQAAQSGTNNADAALQTVESTAGTLTGGLPG